MPAIYADMLVGTFRAARHGDVAVTDPRSKNCGRVPKTIREVLSEVTFLTGGLIGTECHRSEFVTCRAHRFA